MVMPAKITPEMIENACDMIAGGTTLTAAAKKLGVKAPALRYHFLRDAELKGMNDTARELGCDALADECIDIADDPDIDVPTKRVRIDTRIRLIGKWSQRYSDKHDVNMSGVMEFKGLDVTIRR